jgi:hypothetical protein
LSFRPLELLEDILSTIWMPMICFYESHLQLER